MHDRRSEIDGRLGRWVPERIAPVTHTVLGELALEVWHVPASPDGTAGEPVPFEVARGAVYQPARVGDRWGPAWGTAWFHVTGTVPATATRPELLIDLGWAGRRPGMQAEGLVHRPDGSIVKALNPLNNWIPVTPGEVVDLYVEAAANPVIGPGYGVTAEGDRETSTRTPIYRITRADVCEVNTDVVELAADLDVLDQLRRTLGDSPQAYRVLYGIEAALDALDPDDVVGTAAAARAELAPLLAGPAHASAHRVSAVGHAHIDSAWLWPVRETMRKVARTVGNVVHLMDIDPDLVHCMSSAQQWDWLRTQRPELFERVLAHVETGRFVPTGGMWVESDTNLVGGEAMARQFVMGKRWFIEHTGIEPEEVWLPDSFGYTAALPQIVRLAGFKWFLTQKISWNTVNKFPHHTFWWEGIDGSRVFTHFPPADTYNGTLSGTELARSANNSRDKGKASRALIPFGFGDGGGGPTREMLARARRTRDLEGSPRVVVESPRAFFAAAEQDYPDAPVWVGELYLEIHRGTYTSQARTKQGNRRSEHLLREAELWCATAAVRGLLPYPYDELEELWRLVLLQQFHDILPGSSIAWVHREAEHNYAAIARRLETLITAALDALTDGDQAPRALMANAAPVPVRGVAAGAVGVPEPSRATSVAGRTLDNGVLRLSLDRAGAITELTDLRAGRDVLPPGGRGALLQLHRDTPTKWDAWDLDRHYRQHAVDLTGEVTRSGDGLLVSYDFGSSTAEITVTLDDDQVLLDVVVDWHEREKVLKLGFDLDVHTDQARYETQFGHVVRPTHENTSWDEARFEVCAHRWIQVADGGYGVAIANDSTYGHDVTRRPRRGGGTFSRARLTLLRAPRYPDPESDQGRHRFRVALVPGADVARAAAAGYALNLPLRRVDGAAVDPLVRIGAVGPDGAAIVETVKLAEDRSGDLVVRLYESRGARSATVVRTTLEDERVVETDLLERELGDGDSPRSQIGLDPIRLGVGPFQIVTLRFARR